ncbi:ROK family protein [Microbacter margulisiae]|uniref:Glucokinase n=1 Tax=Microbacter margulisiae TaxID=1350067 RepID=A0A7W5H1B9_9PORP|nr:ROK family protein [Microbacter margulisiae]MBB3186545.1 glucokinase [Microbacter margulisiae]
MNTQQIIGIDLGGTQVRAGLVEGQRITHLVSGLIPAGGNEQEVLEALYLQVDALMQPTTRAIGIGVPSVVDVEEGIVYDVQNIPSWKEVHLRSMMEERYHIPVYVNNDANCFALGEKYFGQGRGVHSMVGLTIGTGLGSGIIIHDKLYEGINCGAGEFGEVAYLDHNYEYFASGQFFRNCYDTTGEKVFGQAVAGDKEALAIFESFGIHLGNAVKMILYAYDPELIILGGSISQSYELFQESMWRSIRRFTYQKSLEKFRLVVSELESCGVLGAAALYYDKQH